MRVHEAAVIPCAGCGRSLPVDPTAAHAWCAACHAWREVPAQIVQQVGAQHAALAQARAAREAHHAEAFRQRRRATIERIQGVISGVFGGVMLLVSFGGLLPTLLLYGIAIPIAIVEEMEPWAAALTLLLLGVTGIGLLAAVVGGGVWIYRRLTRRRRWSALGHHAEWHGPAQGQSAPAVCGECGAPLAFAAGEHAVQCGYCRAVVLATPEHATALVTFALSELQLARAASAKAARDLLRAQHERKTKSSILGLWLGVGSLACLALPLLAVLYAWRALTPSLEEAMERLARQVQGDLASGTEAAFEWLDAFWIGDTPPGFEVLPAALDSRWSVAALFHERPVLVSVHGTWSDRVAKSATLLLARPRQRDPARIAASPAAERVRALGWSIHPDYAGIALVESDLGHDAFTVERITELARAAYELAEA